MPDEGSYGGEYEPPIHGKENKNEESSELVQVEISKPFPSL